MPTAAKPAIASVTIWGILLSAFCTLFPALAGYLHLTDPAIQTQIVNFVGQIGAVLGLAISLYGRLTANAPISGVLKTSASLVAVPSMGQVENAGATIIAGLAEQPPKPPPSGVVSALLAILAIGLILIGGSGLTACATTAASVTAVQLDEGKALDTIVTASDALALALDAGAKSGAIKGSAATTARQALMDLQVGLSLAQTAYTAQDGTAAQRIAALATLLDDAEAALPVSTSTRTAVDAATAAAVAVAKAY